MRNGLVLGIAVEPDGVAASLFERSGKLIAASHAECRLPLQDNAEVDLSAPFGEAIAASVASFPAQLRRADNDVRLFLPAPCFAQSDLAFDAFPRSQKDAAALVRWQHCKKLSLSEENSCIGYIQETNRRTSETRVLAQSASRDFVELICDALAHQGLQASSVESLDGSLRREIELQAEASPHLQIWQSKGWWSFQLFDAAGWPKPIFAAWKTQRYSEAALLDRLERALRTSGLEASEALALVQLHRLGEEDGHGIDAWAKSRGDQFEAYRYASWGEVLVKAAFS